MNHEMRLDAGPFGQIQAGSKTIEARLNDAKRQGIKVGDRIVFALRPDEVEKIEVEVTELLHAPTFAELHTMRPLAEFGKSSPEQVEELYQYYSKEDEAKYGVVGIVFKKI